MLEGKWQLVSGEFDGNEIPAGDCERSTMEIVGNTHDIVFADGRVKGTHVLDTSANPMTIDASDTEGQFAGETLLGIFKVEGDQFAICMAAPGQPRPTDYTTKNGHAVLMHRWNRVADAPANSQRELALESA